MKHVASWWLVVSVLLVALVAPACGSTSSASSSSGAAEVDAGAPRELPEVWGHTAAVDENPDPHVVEVRLEATRTTIELGGKNVEMFGYNGLVPGPLIRVRAGDELVVHFHNGLDQPTTIHWHGLRIPADMDGSPRIQSPVEPGGDFTYRFVVPEAGSYWYHPHVRAHEQIEAGLYAPLVVWDDRDPAYDVERYVMLDDILLDATGQRAKPFANAQDAMFGRYGDRLFTNGRTGTLVAEATSGAVERWRLVNAANARTMRVKVEGARVRVIGTDGGLLPEPYAFEELTIAVGQRFDLEVTYDAAGTVKLSSFFAESEKWRSILQVDVAESELSPREIPWPEVVLPDRASDESASIVIDAVNGGEHGVQWRLNGEVHPEDPLFTFPEGRVVTITIDNTIGPEHPFHLHGQFFRVLGDAKQPGLKDTVLVPGFTKVKIRAYFDNPGRWMAHCHILEHSELGMMSEIVVTPADGSDVGAPVGGHGH